LLTAKLGGKFEGGGNVKLDENVKLGGNEKLGDKFEPGENTKLGGNYKKLIGGNKPSYIYVNMGEVNIDNSDL